MQAADKKIAELVADIVREQRHWKYLSQNGLDYGKYRGLGQWRNSGKGRFTWERIAP